MSLATDAKVKELEKRLESAMEAVQKLQGELMDVKERLRELTRRLGQDECTHTWEYNIHGDRRCHRCLLVERT